MGQFQKHIRAFNTMYRLPCTDRPTLNIGVPVKQRLFDFKAILIEELNEIDEIIDVVDAGAASEDTPTSLADLLGDIQVYCASEMAKFGIPLDETLEIIMQSNFFPRWVQMANLFMTSAANCRKAPTIGNLSRALPRCWPL